MNIVRDLFGAGTWGAGGNLVAWVLCGGLAFSWSHAKAEARHQEALAQQRKQHAELKQHITDATATPPPSDNEGN